MSEPGERKRSSAGRRNTKDKVAGGARERKADPARGATQTLDDETAAALTLYNTYLIADREQREHERAVRKAEKAKDEAAAAIRKLNERKASAAETAEAEAAYRETLAALQSLRDGDATTSQHTEASDDGDTDDTEADDAEDETADADTSDAPANDETADADTSDAPANDEAADADTSDAPANDEAADADTSKAPRTAPARTSRSTPPSHRARINSPVGQDGRRRPSLFHATTSDDQAAGQPSISSTIVPSTSTRPPAAVRRRVRPSCGASPRSSGSAHQHRESRSWTPATAGSRRTGPDG